MPREGRDTVLVVGNGAREHALAWALARSPWVGRVYCAPGNAGTSGVAANLPVEATDLPGIVAAARTRAVDLVVIGPEAPLSLGLADALIDAGVRVCGPTQAAARIESSKIFAKNLMVEQGVPTPEFRIFDDPRDALAYLDRATYPLVVKADGLAAGKGVVVCAGRLDAFEAVDHLMVRRTLGEAGDRILVENCVEGREVSVLVFTDGETVVPLLPAQDYKRVDDGDRGPNTGGMGSIAPAMETLALEEIPAVLETIIYPTLHGLRERGTTFRGVLYAGLMRTPEGFQTLEFNARLGDPETQVLLPLLRSDLYTILNACAQGGQDSTFSLDCVAPGGTLFWYNRAAVCVVIAAAGYPQQPRAGDLIAGLDTPLHGHGAATDSAPPSSVIFHGGTALDASGRVITSGGRILSVVGIAPTREEARQSCYQRATTVSFNGMHYRRDIAAQSSLPSVLVLER